MTESTTATPLDQMADFVHRHLLWLLVGMFVLATFAPQFGIAIRDFEQADPIWGEVPISLPLLLLGLLLFCAALSTKVESIRDLIRRPAPLVAGTVAVWMGPVLLVMLVGALAGDQLPDGILVGLALVATMPVANSSVGWSHNARGDLALSLGLIIASIALCPWVTPSLLRVAGLSMSSAETAYVDLLVTRFSGKFFIVWVVLPTVMGFTIQYLVGRDRISSWGQAIRLVSAGALLLLNYANASLALPSMIRQSHIASIATCVVLAVLLSGIGMFAAVAISRGLRQSWETVVPLVFGVSMKHTGLAIVVAGSVLHEEPRAILMIVVATLTQHVMAGVAQWWMEKQPSTS